MATPEERPPEPRGTPHRGKIGKLRIASGTLGVRGPTFCFFFFVAIYGGFVYFAFSRGVLGVNGQPRGTPPRNPTDHRGSVKWGITIRIRNFRDSPRNALRDPSERYGAVKWGIATRIWNFAGPWLSLVFCFLRRPSKAVSSISHGILRKALGRLR